MSRVITENHPFMKKVNELYDKMEELGIRIEYAGAGGLKITDTNSNKEYMLKDIGTSECLSYFPTGIEFKLTFED